MFNLLLKFLALRVLLLKQESRKINSCLDSSL